MLYLYPTQRYITLFDYESETVTTVPYSGQIVDEMLNMQKRWPVSVMTVMT